MATNLLQKMYKSLYSLLVYSYRFVIGSKYYVSIFVLICISYLPIFVFAYKNGQPENLKEFVNNFIGVINILVPFAAFFGFFGFLTGVLKYVGAGGDEERLGQAKQLIIYGLVGLLIIFSFWGIAKLIARTYLGV